MEPMKFCPNCGNKLAENAVFCGNCGTKVGEIQPAPEAPVQPEAVITPAEPAASEPVIAPAEPAASEPVIAPAEPGITYQANSEPAAEATIQPEVTPVTPGAPVQPTITPVVPGAPAPKKSKKKLFIILGAIALVLIIGVVALVSCGGGSSSSSSSSSGSYSDSYSATQSDFIGTWYAYAYYDYDVYEEKTISEWTDYLYMDVYSDGTWYLDDEGYEDEGTWYVSNGELTMYDEWGDLYGTAYISGDTLYLDWIYWGDMELYMVQ